MQENIIFYRFTACLQYLSSPDTQFSPLLTTLRIWQVYILLWDPLYDTHFELLYVKIGQETKKLGFHAEIRETWFLQNFSGPT